jgi:hypothetical protein
VGIDLVGWVCEPAKRWCHLRLPKERNTDPIFRASVDRTTLARQLGFTWEKLA